MVPYLRMKEGWVSDICGCEGGRAGRGGLVTSVGVREGGVVSDICGCVQLQVWEKE